MHGQNALLNTLNSENVITVGFPCNQFGKQEPAEADEILNCYTYVRPGHGWIPNHNFLIMNKIDVNGKNEDPLYTFLKGACRAVKAQIGIREDMFWDPIYIGDITWNFGKFLIDKFGKPRYRFGPSVTPQEIESFVQELLDE